MSCYKYSAKWVDLFYDNKEQIVLNPVFFLKGNHYLLESLFYLRHYQKFKSTLKQLETITQEDWFPVDDNVEGLTFLYVYNNKFNFILLKAVFMKACLWLIQVLVKLKKYQDRIDEHHVMVFYYKIASLYFGAGENKKCIFFLEKIINNKSLEMREDLLCFARVLNLVAHYEAGLDYNLEALIKSTYKFLIKMEDLYEVQKEMIKFLRGLGDIFPHEVKGEFIKLHKKLKQFEDDPYQSRAFLYLDIISWLESKIQNRPIDLVIKNKFHDNLVRK